MTVTDDLQKLKTRIREDVRALLELELSAETRTPFAVKWRTGNLADPFEAKLYSFLEQSGLTLVRCAANQSGKRGIIGAFTFSEAIDVAQDIYAFLEDVWLTTGDASLLRLVASPDGTERRVIALRDAIWKEAQRFCAPMGTRVSGDLRVDPVPSGVAAGDVCQELARPNPELPKKRGRKSKFSQHALNEAREMKRANRPNREIAKCLYGISNPSEQQCRNVPTLLNYHFPSNK
jgi:hypothetical protein